MSGSLVRRNQRQAVRWVASIRLLVVSADGVDTADGVDIVDGVAD